MERETDFFHLFTQHQFIIFVGVSLLIMVLLFGIGVVVGRRAERKGEKRRSDESQPK